MKTRSQMKRRTPWWEWDEESARIDSLEDYDPPETYLLWDPPIKSVDDL